MGISQMWRVGVKLNWIKLDDQMFMRIGWPMIHVLDACVNLNVWSTEISTEVFQQLKSRSSYFFDVKSWSLQIEWDLYGFIWYLMWLMGFISNLLSGNLLQQTRTGSHGP